MITSSKTKKNIRTIKMSKFLCEEMQYYIGMLYGKKGSFFSIIKSYLYHEMERGAKEAGVKHIRICAIRHPYEKRKCFHTYSCFRRAFSAPQG